MFTIIDEGRRLQITGNLTGDVIYIPKSKASVWAIDDTVLIEYYYNEKSRPIDRQIWTGLYTNVSYPHTDSAQELKNIINEMITGANTITRIISVAPGMFISDKYTNSSLIGKTADSGFAVWGSVKMYVDDDYGFDPDIGEIDMSGDYGGAARITLLVA